MGTRLILPTICYLVPVMEDMYIHRLGPLLPVDERADILRRVKTGAAGAIRDPRVLLASIALDVMTLYSQ